MNSVQIDSTPLVGNPSNRQLFGPANLITTGRAALVLLIAGPVLHGLAGLAGSGRLPIWVSLVALLAVILDGLDGYVARRTGTVTAFGARYDMEVDAALIMLLCLPAAVLVGPWVLLIGLARYLWMLLVQVAPRLGTPVPARRWRKGVAVAQAAALIVASSAVVPRTVSATILAVALAALGLSFATQAATALRLSNDAEPARNRRGLPLLGSCVAVLLIWSVLTWPGSGWPSPGSLLRVPAELLVLLALALLLRPGRIAHLILGLTLTVVVLLHVLDAGFTIAFDRPFHVATDPGRAGAGFGLLRDSSGAAVAYAVVIGSLLAIVALATGLTWAAARAAALVRRPDRVVRPGILPGLLAGSLAWALGFGTSAAVVPGLPLASRSSYDVVVGHLSQWQADRADRAAFGRLIAADPDAQVPAKSLVAGLAGHDVLVVFVESYGRFAVQDSAVAADVNRSLEAATRTIAGNGFAARSGFVTSPTYGGLSWLAHSTLQTGLPVTSQARYDQVLDTDRSTLSGIFGEAGWRTFCADPANREPWPPARDFYHCDAVYDSTNLGYAGPSMGYPLVPDQFTLHALAQREFGPGHNPVMGEVDLVTSHTPWRPVPRLVPSADLGDGSVYDDPRRAPDNLATLTGLTESARQTIGYGRTISYSISAVAQFLAELDDPNLVVVLLGDHQPNAMVSGAEAGHDVPISVIANDRAVLRRLSSWGWARGLQPSTTAATYPMADFRTRFLDAFGG